MKIDDKASLTLISQQRKEGVEAGEEGARKAGAVTNQDSSKGSDKVVLSTNERVDKVTASLEQIPEIRWDKVAEIKSKLDSGNYEVSGRQVAEKMLSAWKRTQ